MARIVDAVVVDNARADKAAQLENMVPIPAVPSDPGRLETKHRTDIAGAQPRDQTLEPGSRNRAASRQTEILIDDLDCGFLSI